MAGSVVKMRLDGAVVLGWYANVCFCWHTSYKCAYMGLYLRLSQTVVYVVKHGDCYGDGYLS